MVPGMAKVCRAAQRGTGVGAQSRECAARLAPAAAAAAFQAGAQRHRRARHQGSGLYQAIENRRPCCSPLHHHSAPTCMRMYAPQ